MTTATPMSEYIEELFAGLGQIRTQKMFGAAGIYAGEEMFALADDERVYLKTDDSFKDELESRGGEHFEWTNKKTGKTIRMSYVSMPDEALDDHELAADLGLKALRAARRARQAKVKSPRRRV